MDSGYKTISRTMILDFLKQNSSKTVSVSDISAYLINQGSPVNITTIYRYLDKLEKNGVVNRYISGKGNKSIYQFVGEGDNCQGHLHLKCTECGKIFHLDCSFMNEIEEHISGSHGFYIQCKNSLIYGVCQDCFEKKKERKDR